MNLSILQSLSGHQSAVESVTFDKEEEMVAAGAASGSIKIFDLSSAKGTLKLFEYIEEEHTWCALTALSDCAA